MPWTPGPGATAGNDVFVGDGNSEDVFGLAGDDILNGMGGSDRLDGGPGNDTLNGGDDVDYLTGGGGRDSYNGGVSFDTAFMDYSTETLAIVIDNSDPSVVRTILRGGSAYGTITGVETLRFIGGSGNDVVIAISGAGGNYNILEGRDGDDTLTGGSDVDYIWGGAGNDTLDGGGGLGDTLVYSDAASGVTIDLSITSAQNTIGAGIDTVVNFENLMGSDFADTMSGDAGANFMYGGLGNDTISGGDGNDFIRGEGGADTIYGGAGMDRIESNADEDDVVYGGDGDDWIGGHIVHGDAGDDRMFLNGIFNPPREDTAGGFAYGGDGDDEIDGGSQFDVIDGGAGNDILHRSLGADQMFGGDGDDIIYSYEDMLFLGLYPEWMIDTIDGGAGDDLIYAGYGDTIDGGSNTAAGDALVLVLVNAVDIFVSVELDLRALDPNIAFALPGGASLIGVEHVVGVYGSWGVDLIYHTEDGGYLDGGASDDVIYGLGGDDTINGNGNDDTLYGGAGDDDINGSLGNDELHGGAGNDILEGSGGSDVVYGDDGDDIVVMTRGPALTGEAGAVDFFDGGDGEDLLDFQDIWNFNNSPEGITFSLAIAEAQHVTMGPVNDFGWITALNFENLSGTRAADTLSGTDGDNYLGGWHGNDQLYGEGGDDTLWAGLGADTLRGGAGNDTYIVDDAFDTLIEAFNAGVDLVQASLTFTLTANFENLTLTGGGAINGFGNVLNNIITGNGAANQLNGFDGNDTLDGGAGADNMFGGNGDDTYYVDNAGDQTTEGSALGGTDIVFSSVNRNLTANIENLTLTGTADLTGSGNTLNNVITGNSGANTLYGFDGNDTLNGGTGADTLFGANGDDIYYVDNVNDITVEGSPTGGIDTVFSSIDRNLNANFENLTLIGTAQYGYGNVLNNVMTGNASSNSLYGFDGNDTLDGGAGADFMFGANGDDTYIVDNAGDVTSETSPSGGVDTVISSVTRNLTANLENLTLSGTADITGAGNALNNVIIGNSGANTLYGLDGADTLDGGLGADTLQGGAGADNYVFSTALGGGNIDSVVGFNVVDDTIVLSNAIFTGLSVGTLAASAFVIGAAAADADDRIIYNSVTGALFFDADGNGGGAAVQFATLTAGLALTNSDFIVSGP